MNVLVSVAHRFHRTPDGSVWTSGAFARSFWDRYLTTFDGVRVMARVLDVAAVADNWRRADGEGVTFAPMPYYRGPWSYLTQARRVRAAAQAAFVEGDAVIFRVPCQLADCLAPRLRRLRYPYAVEVVGDPYDVLAPGSLQHPLRRIFRWYFPRQLRRQCADACGAAYVTRSTLPRRYPCPSYSSYFSDVELPLDAWAIKPRSLRTATQTFTLVSVGSLEQPYKGIDVLLEAMAICVRKGLDLRLIVVGDGQCRPALEAQAAALQLRERVVFRGQVPGGEGVRNVLDVADLFVMPSRTEGLPRAMIEAMARALPCLGSRIGGIPELLPDEDLVTPGDASDLSVRIAEMVADPARLARASERNLRAAAAYRPEILRERLLAFYGYVQERTRAWMKTKEASKRQEQRVNIARDGGATVLAHALTVPQSLGFLSGQVDFVKALGFEVHVITSPGGSLVRFGDEHEVATHEVLMSRRITPYRDLVSLWHLRRVLRRVRPHIVHGHTPKGGLLSMIAAWSLGVPVRIYHVHGLPLTTATGMRRRLLRFCEKTACFFAHQVLCVSPSVREIVIAERICPKEKIKVLHHGSIDGVDAGHFDPARFDADARRGLRERLGIPADSLVLGFVGRIVRDKGVIELVESWRTIREEFPQAHLLLVGGIESQDPIPPEIEDQLHRDPRIHLAGIVRDVAPFYSAMDLLALPSYREGFPVVPLEAAAMELPVVATCIPGCIDAIRDGVTGTLVPARDVDALTEAVRRYLRDPLLRPRHGQAARARILRDYQPEGVADALHQEYRRLLERITPAPTFYQRRGKRWLDLLLTIPALVLLTPLLLALTVVVRLFHGSPAIFRQRRAGWHGEPFIILKFRSMSEECDAEGRLLSDGLRLTRLGRFLRATSLDELPELLNVLKGDMSLVGPRPLYECYLPYYEVRERKRFDCRPGVTGWAQINGRNSLPWNERLKHDVWYVEHATLWLDIKILCRTVWKVLKRADVHVDTNEVIRPLDEERGQPAELFSASAADTPRNPPLSQELQRWSKSAF